MLAHVPLGNWEGEQDKASEPGDLPKILTSIPSGIGQIDSKHSILSAMIQLFGVGERMQ